MRLLSLTLLAAAALIGACDGEAGGPAEPQGAASASSEASSFEPPADLPPELAKLHAQAGRLLDGGADAFEARLRELRGHPVVVNKWASWCAPCRAEFPFLRSQAEKRSGEVAFLGVDSQDDPGDAAAFLDEFPVPYPSYLDPDLEVAAVMGGVAAFPTTAFYDAKGDLAYVKQGGYATEEQLAADIERYAR